MRPAVTCRGISKRYAASGASPLTVLRDVDLTLDFGRLSVLMGPSGSGKTTLMRIAGCIAAPDAGEVTVIEQKVAALSVADRARLRARHVGFAFQEPRLFDALTAIENVLVGLAISGHVGADAARRAEQALAMTEIADRATSYPRELSGGQKQRVALARALAGEKAILFCDEPTASLDAAAAGDIAALLRRLVESHGCAALIVSHDRRFLSVAHEGFSLQDGRLAALDTEGAGA